MDKTFVVSRDILYPDEFKVPVTYQGNKIGYAVGIPDGVAISIDDMYIPIFENILLPKISAFSLEVNTNGQKIR